MNISVFEWKCLYPIKKDNFIRHRTIFSIYLFPGYL